MKKLLAFIVLAMAMVSCYEGYIKDYVYTSVYFPYQFDVRSFVVGEGMKVEVGPALGGVRKNTVDRDVSYILDNTLLAPALAKMKVASNAYIKDPATPVVTMLLLPTNYYTITNPNTFVIKAGWHGGTVLIKPDSTLFLNDSVNTINATYALPFKITDADVDSILPLKNYNVVAFRFENKFFGMYWHGGSAVINRPALTDTTIVYKTTIPTAEANIWKLKTVGPNTVYTNGYFNQTTAKNELKLVFKGNTVYVSVAAATPGLPATAPTFTYTADGASKFNGAKLLQDRRLVLKYKYTNPGNGWTYHCTDTLTFRNRLRDGISEWQDEDPSHYTK